MVGGRFKCLGSSQHLKNRFCRSYKVEVRCRVPEETEGASEETEGSLLAATLDPVVTFMRDRFPGSKVDERHGLFLRFEIPSSIVSLAETFAVIESQKAKLNIEDYAVSQGTLEQVFIQFAKTQTEETSLIEGLAYDADGHQQAGSLVGTDLIAQHQETSVL